MRKSPVKEKIEIVCIQCGNKFITHDCHKNKKYCSKECYSNNQKGKSFYTPPNTQVEKVCLNCGKKYKVWKNRENKAKYCSMDCHGQHKHKRLSENHKCRYCGKEFFVRLSSIKKGKGLYCSPECQRQSPEWRELCRIGIIQALKTRKHAEWMQPNNAEIKIIDVIKELNLPYKFVGDGNVWIAGFNPDFINVNGQKKIIELFGEPWHKPGYMKGITIPSHSTEQGRKNIFSKYGYDTLVIWSKELRNIEEVKKKIMAFEKSPHVGG